MTGALFQNQTSTVLVRYNHYFILISISGATPWTSLTFDPYKVVSGLQIRVCIVKLFF